MSLFSKYQSKVRRRLNTRLKAGVPLLLFIPPSIDQTAFMTSLGYKVVDISSLIVRYPSRYLDRLRSRVKDLLNKGYEVITNLEYMYYLFPREREIFNSLLSSLEGPVITTFSMKYLFESAVKLTKFDSMSLTEASLDDIPNAVKDDNLFLSEGSPTFPDFIGSYVDHVVKQMLMIRDSNERFLLYYFTRYRGIGRLARVMGPELGTYLNRLMRKGFIVRAGERRGVYFVRDPLIRYYIHRAYMPLESPYKYVGYLYLIRKFFEGIKGRVSIPTYSGDLYIAESEKFYFLNRNSFMLVDMDRVRYLFRISLGLREDLKYMEKYPRVERVLITPSDISSRSYRSFERVGIKILRVKDINSFTRFTNFPRLI